MDSLYSPQSRSERLIAAGRVVLASSSLFAVWLDPSEPAKYAHVAYGLLSAYLAYASLVAVLAWRSDTPGRWRLVSHGFDLLFFALFIYFTEGTASPFNAFFVFALVCATLRWQTRGALWTAAASLLAFLGVGVYFGEVLEDPSFELHTVIIRGVYLVVIAVLLGYVGAHEQRTRREISLLAAAPSGLAGSAEALTRELLQHAASVVGSPRVALAWRPSGSSEGHLSIWDGGELSSSQPAADELEALVADEHRDSSYLWPELASARPLALRKSPAGFARCRWEALVPEARDRWQASSLLTSPVAGEGIEGRLFYLDKPAMTSDDLLLGEVVAGLVASRLGLFFLTEQLRRAAALEERIRLARDLHDGVLQSLTGIALRLAAAQRVSSTDREEAARQLEEVRKLIAFEQRDLRFFIQELKPPQGSSGEGLGLEARLLTLAERIREEWGLQVEARLEVAGQRLPEELARDVYHLVREALFNAARHAEAREVRVEIADAPGGRLAITVTDDGRGFPFEGRFTGPQLARQGLGPKSLRERVAALEGSFRLSSSRAGSRLEIELPR